MYSNSLKKSVIFILIYAFLIIGIFVLQFKNDLIISEKIGSLHITLLESVNDEGVSSLKNKMTVSFNGITFSNSDEKSGFITINNKKKPLVLQSWQKIEPLSCRFNFKDNIAIIFNLSNDSSTAHLTVSAEMPSNASSLYLPYSLSSGATILQQSDTKIQIGSKKNSWELSANDIGEDKIAFTQREKTAHYSYFDYTKAFSFEQVASFDGASDTQLLNSLIQLKQNLISSFESLNSETVISEQEAVSYVAAMSETGKFTEAIEKVPSSFKKNSSRTFLSAPYFNTLQKMNENLKSYLERCETLVSYAAANSKTDVFTALYIADYMCMHPGSKNINTLLENTALLDAEKIPVLHAAGILSVYSELIEKNKTLAEKLLPVTEPIIDKIEKMCTLDDDIITVSENGKFLSVIDGVKIGSALIRYGKIAKLPEVQRAGRLIVNSYLKNCSSFDLKTLAELYPIVVKTNRYYPHFEILTFANGKAIWAFTCANNIGYENTNDGIINITVDFPVSCNHYIIFDGIPQFESIYIYNLKFRTDERFETYNSSGYVYEKATETLLLKSRHKTELETIRLDLNKEKIIVDENPVPVQAENSTENTIE